MTYEVRYKVEWLGGSSGYNVEILARALGSKHQWGHIHLQMIFFVCAVLLNSVMWGGG